MVPQILAEHFELKHSLINMMTSDQFFGLEKENPHDHIRWFNKITSTIKYKDVPNSMIKPMLFPFSLAGAACQWLEKEPTHLLRACPHHGFTELNQLDTIYNALYPADQDSLNSAAGGNLLERRTQDVLTIIKNKYKVRNSRNKSVVSQVKSCDASSNSSSKIAKLTHAVNQQTSVVTNTMTAILKQFQATPPLAFVKPVEEICVTCVGDNPYYQCLAAGGNTFLELRDNIQGYVAAAAVNYNQGNSVYRHPGMANQIRPSGFAEPNVQNNQNWFSQPQGYNQGNNFNQDQSYQAPTQQNQVVPLNELEKVKIINKANLKAMQTQINNVKNELRNEMKNSIQASMSNQTNEIKNMMANLFKLNTTSTSGLGSLPSNTVANPKGELKAITTQSALLSNKEKLQELANTPLNENCSAVILKKLPKNFGDPGKFLIPCGFNELMCKALSDLAGIARDVFVPVGKFTFLADFIIVDYESDPRSSGNPTFSSHPELTLPEVKDDVFDPEGSNVLLEKLLDLDSTKDLCPPLHVNPLSGSTTYFSFPSNLLEEFSDELTLITFSSEYDIESDLKDLEYLLHHDPIKDINSILKDSIDQSNIADLNNNFVDSMPEMFIDELALDYSSPLLFNEYNDDLFEVESDTKNVYDDPFDSKGEKIKESKLLMDELDLPCDLLPSSEYDSFISEDFSKVDAFPSTNNEDKLAISHASLMIEDFDPPLYELPFLKEVPRSEILLLFSSENEEKVFKPGIHTSRKVHSSLITKLSHQGYKVFRINQSPMKIFLFSYGKNTHILDVPCLYFYPLDQFNYGGTGSS
nr:hypothetical protein [Tanacetum cinerariifolium]